MRLKRYWTFRQRKSTKAFTLRVDWSSSICCTMGQPIPLPCCSYERHNAAELVDGPPPSDTTTHLAVHDPVTSVVFRVCFFTLNSSAFCRSCRKRSCQ